MGNACWGGKDEDSAKKDPEDKDAAEIKTAQGGDGVAKKADDSNSVKESEGADTGTKSEEVKVEAEDKREEESDKTEEGGKTEEGDKAEEGDKPEEGEKTEEGDKTE